MAEINLSIRVVAQDGSMRTVEVSSGGTLDIKPGDRLILFGADAAKARLVRQGDDLALVIDDQVVFVFDDYYTHEGAQAAEVITDPAVAATYLTATEGGIPLLTTPVLETGADAGPANAQAPPVDLIQATSPVLPGDNASARSWRSDEDILLDDPTYRPIVIEYLVEDEPILVEALELPPAPIPPAEEAVNLPPYFTTVTVEVGEEGEIISVTPNRDEPVDEYNFQQYEVVWPYQEPMPGPHPTDFTGDPAGGYTFYYWLGGGGTSDVSNDGGIIGWGYYPESEMGFIGVADPENDPLTVQWVNGLHSFELTPPGEIWMVSESLGSDLGGGAVERALYLFVPTDVDGNPEWENVYQVWSGVWNPANPDDFTPGLFEYDGALGVAALYGLTDHFSTTLTVADPYNAPVEAQVNLDILDVNEAPQFKAGEEGGITSHYEFNPWGPENLDPANHPDAPHDPDYEVYVGSVYALDPDFLDQLYGQVLYNFYDPFAFGPSADDPFNPGVPDTAGWRPDAWLEYNLDGLLNINPETGDIWLDIDVMQGWMDDPNSAPPWFNPDQGYGGIVAAHDMVDRFAPVTDGDGEVVYDHDRIYSDLWDLAKMWIEADQAPVLYEIADIYESMQTTTDTLIKSGGVWMIDQADAIMSQGYFVLQADDPDGTDVSFATGDDAYGDTALFNVMEVGGQWRLYFDTTVMPLDQIDFETQDAFDVELVLNDGYLNFTEQVTVNLMNANETPWFDTFGDVDAMPEVASAGTNLAWFTVGEYDAPETISFQLHADDGAGFDPNAYFEVAHEGSQWVVQIKSGVDFEDLLGDVTFKVSVQDDGGPTAGDDLADLFTVNFTVTSVDQSVDENMGLVPWATMSGQYPTGHGVADPLGTDAYGYPDGQAYEYDGNFDNPADWKFEFAADADTYSLSGADADFFDLTWDGATKTYTLDFKDAVLDGTAAQTLNFEALGANTVLDVNVTSTTVSDAGYDLHVDVNNVNETPYDVDFEFGDNIHKANWTQLNESDTTGRFVAQVVFNDEDDLEAATNHTTPSTNDTYHYALEDDHGGLFAIDGSGEITLAAGANLDYELQDVYSLTVRVYDSSLNGSVGYGPLYGAGTFNVEVSDTEHEPATLYTSVDENTSKIDPNVPSGGTQAELPWGSMTFGEVLPTGHEEAAAGGSPYGYLNDATYTYDGNYNGPAQWSYEFTTEGAAADYSIYSVTDAVGYFATTDFKLVDTGTGVAVEFAQPQNVFLNYEDYGATPDNFSLTIQGVDTAYGQSTAYPNDEINDIIYTVDVTVNDVNESPYNLHFHGNGTDVGDNDSELQENATGRLASACVWDEDGIADDTYHYWFWVDSNTTGTQGKVDADELYASLFTDYYGADLFTIDQDDGDIWINGKLDYENLSPDWTEVQNTGAPNEKWADLEVVVFDSSEDGTIGYGPLYTTETLTVHVSDVHTPHQGQSDVDEYQTKVPWMSTPYGEYPTGENTASSYIYHTDYNDPTTWAYYIADGNAAHYGFDSGGDIFKLVQDGSMVKVMFQDGTNLDFEDGSVPNDYNFVVRGTHPDTNDKSWDIDVDVRNVNETPYGMEFNGPDTGPADSTAALDENDTGAFTTVSALDVDTGSQAWDFWFWNDGASGGPLDGKVQDHELSHTSLTGNFTINQSTGVVSIVAPLDYEALIGPKWSETSGDPDIKTTSMEVVAFDSMLTGMSGYGELYTTGTLTVQVANEHDVQTGTFFIDETVGDFPWAGVGFTGAPTGHPVGYTGSWGQYDPDAQNYNYDGTITPNYTHPDGTTYLHPDQWRYEVTSKGDANVGHYHLDADGGPFMLWSDGTGVFVVWDGTPLDYEADFNAPHSWDLVITGNHADTNDVTHNITVNMKNVNEKPDLHSPAGGMDADYVIPEHIDTPYDVYSVLLSDGDDPNSLFPFDDYHYELTGDGAELFEVYEFISSIHVGLKDGADLDHETKSSYNLTLTVYDSAVLGNAGYGPLSDSINFTIWVADSELHAWRDTAYVDETVFRVPWDDTINDGDKIPTGHGVGDEATYLGDYNGPVGWEYKFTPVGTAADYTIDGTNHGLFEIRDASDGFGASLYFIAPESAALDYETGPYGYHVMIKGVDAAGDPFLMGMTQGLEAFNQPEINDSWFDITIRVDNVNETPYNAGFDGTPGDKTITYAETDLLPDPPVIAWMSFDDEDLQGGVTDTYHYWFWVDNDAVGEEGYGEVEADELTSSLDGGRFTVNTNNGRIYVNGNLDFETLDGWNVVDADTKSFEINTVVIDSNPTFSNGYGPLHDTATLTVRVDDRSWHDDLTTTLDENSSRVPWEDSILKDDLLPTGHDLSGVGVSKYGYTDGENYQYDGNYNGPEQWAYKFTEHGTEADYTVETAWAGTFGIRNATGGGVEVYFLNPTAISWDYETDAGSNPIYEFAVYGQGEGAFGGDPSYEYDDVSYGITVDLANVNETPFGLHFYSTTTIISDPFIDPIAYLTENDGTSDIATVRAWDEDTFSTWDILGPNDTYHFWFWNDDGDGEVQAGELVDTWMTDVNTDPLFTINTSNGDIRVDGILDYENLGAGWTQQSGSGGNPDFKWTELDVVVFDSSLDGTVGYGPLHDTATLTITVVDDQSTTPVVADVDEYISTVPWYSPTYGSPANPVGAGMPTGHPSGGTNTSTWGYEGQTTYNYTGLYDNPTLWSYTITTGDYADFNWGGADLGYFTFVDGGVDDGSVTVKLDASQLDYETLAGLSNTVLDITADALIGAENNDVDYTFDVTVKNVNEHPVIDGLAEVSGSLADVNTSTATATFADEESGAFFELQFTDEDEDNGGSLVNPATAIDEYHFLLDDATGLFSINSSGVVSAPTLDFENLGTGWVFSDTDNDQVNDTATATLTAYVYDSALNGSIGYGPLRDAQTITVKVEDVTNHQPVNASVDENWFGAASSYVPWITMGGDYPTGHPAGYSGSTGPYDPNAQTYNYAGVWNDPLAWSYTFADSAAHYGTLSGENAGYFELVDVGGQAVLSFKNNVKLDYEALAANEFVLDVSVSPLATAADNDTIFDFHITVNNVNETPHDVHFDTAGGGIPVISDSIDVTENYAGQLAQVDFSDEDDPAKTVDSYHYWFWVDAGAKDGVVQADELSSTAMDGLFSIDTTTGLITTATLDFEDLADGWTQGTGPDADEKWADLDVAVFDSSLDGDIGYGPLHDTASLRVTVQDDGPTIVNPTSATYDEEVLQDGNLGESYPGPHIPPSNADMPDTAVDPTGTLGITWGSAGPHLTEAITIELLNTGLTTADGRAITWDSATNTASAGSDEVFRLDLVGDNYTYVQSLPLFHDITPAEDDLVLNFTFTAKDAFDDTATDFFTVTVDDDAPVAADDEATITMGEAQAPLNIYYLIDTTGSMDATVDLPGGGTSTRLAIAQEATNNMLAEYGSLGVDVRVTALAFSTQYDVYPNNHEYLLLGTFDVTDSGKLTELQGYISGLSADGRTPYDEVLQYTQAELANDLTDSALTGYENVVYFISDGHPNEGNAPAAWQPFVDTNGIEVIAVGIGNAGDIGTGLNAVENSGDTWIHVEDVNELEATLIATIPEVASGNVLDNDEFGADGPGGLISFSYIAVDGDPPVLVAVAEGGSTTVTTALGGELTMHSNGEWTYNQAGGVEGTETIVYTMADDDDDPFSATLTINILDDDPTIDIITDLAVDEEGLLGGNAGEQSLGGDLAGEAVTVTGALAITFGNDGQAAADPVTLSATGATWDGGSLTLTADNGSWNMVLDPSFTFYTFNLTAPQNGQGGTTGHPVIGYEDDLTIDVTLTVTDGNGTQADDIITVTVDDDAPIANDDLIVTEGANLAPINLYFITDISGSMSGSGIATAKDSLNHLLDEYAGLGVDVRVTLLTFSSYYTDEGTFDITGGELAAAHAEVNSWIADGATNFYDVLTYAQGELTNDLATPALDDYSNRVYFLSDGNPNTGTNSGQAPSGWQGFIDANDIEAFVYGMGTSINLTYLNPIENSDDTAEIVADIGDLDDVLQSTIPAPISGDVLANDNLGADGFGELTSFTYTDEFGVPQTVTTIDGTAVTTEHQGELVVNSDGTWTYTPAAGFLGEDGFTYSLIDGDGDPATATQTIQVIDIVPPVEAVVFQSTDDEDFLGWVVSDLGDVNGDGLDDYIIGAHGDFQGGAYAGAAYVVFGDENVRDWSSPVSLDGLDGTDGFKIVGASAGDLAGWSVANAGDVNGDGINDILVGAPEADGSQPGPSVWVPADNDYDFTDYLDWGSSADGNGDFVIANFMPDINGNMVTATVTGYDGATDRPVTWNWDSSFGVNGFSGYSWEIDGPNESLVVDFSNAVNLSGFTLTNMQGNDEGSAVLQLYGGGEVSIGIDGGGTTEVDFGTSYQVTQIKFISSGQSNDDYAVVGLSGGSSFVQGPDIPVANGGSAYVIYGSDTGFGAEIDLSNLEGGDGSGFKIVGQDGKAGWSVHSAGNYNGDAYGDMIIGAPQAAGTGLLGAAYLVTGAASMPAVNTLDDLIAGGQATKITPSADGEAGYSVGTCDVDGNGISEIVIGAPMTYLGGFHARDGMVQIMNLSGATVQLTGGDGDAAGWSVSGAGDIDGDGYEDVIIGAPGYDDGGNLNAGAAYVVYGGYLMTSSPTTPVDLDSLVGSGNALKIVGANAGDKLGTSVSKAGDVNGDGIDDVIVGAPNADSSIDGEADAGQAVVIFGEDAGGGFGGLGGSDNVIDVADLLDGVNGDEDDGSGVVFEGADAGDRFGQSVSSAGDVNDDNNPADDGGDDVLVGADGANGGDGEAYLLLGSADLGAEQVLEVEEIVTA